MKLRQLEYLIALHEHQTFQKAADKMHVSQPGISIAVRELEEEIGYSLMTRSNQGIRFTEKGLSVVEISKAIMSQIDDIYHLRELQEYSEVIRIAATPHYCLSLMEPAICELQEQYQAADFPLYSHDSMTTLQKVILKDIDFGLIQTSDIASAELTYLTVRHRLICEELFEEDLIFMVEGHHPLLGKASCSLSDLVAYPFLGYGDHMNLQMTELYHREGGRIIRDHSSLSVQKHFKSRQAIGVVPSSTLRFMNKHVGGDMQALTVPEANWKTRICLVYRNNNASPLTSITYNKLKKSMETFAELL